MKISQVIMKGIRPITFPRYYFRIPSTNHLQGSHSIPLELPIGIAEKVFEGMDVRKTSNFQNCNQLYLKIELSNRNS